MKAITTRYKGATDTRGSRIYASDGDGNRLSIPYPHEANWTDGSTHRLAAEALRDKMGWTGHLVGGATKDGYAFTFARGDTVIQELRDSLASLLDQAGESYPHFEDTRGTANRERAARALDATS